MSKWQQILSATTGIVFLVTLLVIAVVITTPTDFQVFVFRTVLAIAAGAFATVMSGFLHVESKWKQLSVRAGAGLAVFLVIFAVNPPRLIQRMSGLSGFVPPSTTRQGDNSVAIAATSDGRIVSLLADRLVLDLQGSGARTQDTVTMTTTLEIGRSDRRTPESVLNNIRGAVILSKGTTATLSMTVGSRHVQYEYPTTEQRQIIDSKNALEPFSIDKSITTAIDWPSAETALVRYPVTISLFAQRRAKTDVAYLAIDSLDASIKYDEAVGR